MAIKWGVMGTANVADWGVIPGMLQAKDCELYAIAGRYEEKVNAYKEKFGFQNRFGSPGNTGDTCEKSAHYFSSRNLLISRMKLPASWNRW